MKKLTAGIFATLLAVVSADSAYAAIASSGYVDEKVGVVQTAVDAVESNVSTLQNTVAGKADKATTLSGYGITDAYTSAKGTALEGRVSAVEAPKATVATGQTGPVSGQTVFDAIQGVSGDVSGVTSDVGTLKTDMAQAKEDISALETASANHVVKNEAITGGTHTKITYDAKGLVTAGANLTADDIPTIPNTKVSGLGSLSTKSSVATADIADKAVTEAKLSDTVNASLDLADSALQQADLADYVTETEANAAYAVKTLEGQVGVVSKENMGTTTATTVVAGVKEAIDAAKAADTKAGSAATAAAGAQSAVDAVESTIGGYGDIVSHDASDFATAAQGTKADTAVQPADITNVERTANKTTTLSGTSTDAQYPSAKAVWDTIKAETEGIASSSDLSALTTRVTTAEGDIDDLEAAVNNAESGLAATNTIADSALSTAQSAQTTANAALPKATYNSQVGTVTAGNMGTTASTVVTAIKEVAGKASGAQSAAEAADSKAQAAQETAKQAQQTANAAIPAPDGECADGTAKCVLTFNNSAYAWEVIARNGEGE